MLIRSQNRGLLISFERAPAIGILETRNCGVKVTCSDTDETLDLGSYSTKEKALKVLDMIGEAYTRTGLAKAIASEMAKVLGRTSAGIDDELAKSTGKALVKLMCFQMPADNEVEV